MNISDIVEVLKAIGAFFIHPLFYLFVMTAMVMGIRRTRKERHFFQVRINDFLVELKEMFIPGILIGLILSSFVLILGFVLPVGALVLIAFSVIVCLATFQIRLLSGAYVIGAALILSLLLPEIVTGSGFLEKWMDDIRHTPLFNFAILLSVLLVVEGFLIVKFGARKTSPVLIKSNRGKWIGAHVANKIWMIPMFVLIPGQVFSIGFEWWPVFSLGEQQYNLLLVPFGIGFHQRVQASLPSVSIQQTGKHVLLLSFAVFAFAIASYWLSFLAIIAGIVAILGRECISYRQRVTDDQHVSYFKKREQGIVILEIIPQSPAAKMGLAIGEIITKVNGQMVNSEQAFYKALQTNRAYCKLEVLDDNGEPRFAQRALYDGENHKLGILFVTDDKDWGTKVVS